MARARRSWRALLLPLALASCSESPSALEDAPPRKDAAPGRDAPSPPDLRDAARARERTVADLPAGDLRPSAPPDGLGPYPVGLITLQLYDSAHKKTLETKVWYPGTKPASGATPVTYLLLIKGNAYANLPLSTHAPFPLVLFSHGHKGLNVQSFTFTEYLASHGFVVAAPNHPGDTILDSPSDLQTAQIALNRPEQIGFVYDKLVKANTMSGDPLYGAIDTSAVGVSGHSFGGFTALVVAGAEVDLADATARCTSGLITSTFCKYVTYWPTGTVLKRPSSLSGVKAGLFMAPGGYAAFGNTGLAKIAIPTVIMGGTLDDLTTLVDEIRPIFNGTGATPRYKVEITGAGHMSFTDICRLPGSALIPGLADLCKPGTYIKVATAFEIVNTIATAFFRQQLKGEKAMASYLTAQYLAKFTAVAFTAK